MLLMANSFVSHVVSITVTDECWLVPSKPGAAYAKGCKKKSKDFKFIDPPQSHVTSQACQKIKKIEKTNRGLPAIRSFTFCFLKK